MRQFERGDLPGSGDCGGLETRCPSDLETGGAGGEPIGERLARGGLSSAGSEERGGASEGEHGRGFRHRFTAAAVADQDPCGSGDRGDERAGASGDAGDVRHGRSDRREGQGAGFGHGRSDGIGVDIDKSGFTHRDFDWARRGGCTGDNGGAHDRLVIGTAHHRVCAAGLENGGAHAVHPDESAAAIEHDAGSNFFVGAAVVDEVDAVLGQASQAELAGHIDDFFAVHAEVAHKAIHDGVIFAELLHQRGVVGCRPVQEAVGLGSGDGNRAQGDCTERCEDGQIFHVHCFGSSRSEDRFCGTVPRSGTSLFKFRTNQTWFGGFSDGKQKDIRGRLGLLQVILPGNFAGFFGSVDDFHGFFCGGLLGFFLVSSYAFSHDFVVE